MDRPLILLTMAVATAAFPLSAAAQAWPATVVASVQAIPKASVLHRDATSLRALREAPPMPALKIRPARLDTADVPNVELRPRPEWSDDQGFRMTMTKVAYKQRF